MATAAVTIQISILHGIFWSAHMRQKTYSEDLRLHLALSGFKRQTAFLEISSYHVHWFSPAA